MSQLYIYCHQNGASNTGNGLHPTRIVRRGPMEQYSLGCCQGWLFTTDDVPIDEDSIFKTHWTQRNRAGAYLEPSLVKINVHGTGRYFAC